jgi:hypothetical protein
LALLAEDILDLYEISDSVTQGLTSSAKSTSNLQTTVNQTQTKPPGTPQKLFLYNINGQLVTAQGVPVTVDNGILKILPQPKIQMSLHLPTIVLVEF